MRSKYPNKTKHEMSYRNAHNTQSTPKQPGDGNDLESACDETCSTSQPITARFYESWVCGNRPRTADVDIASTGVVNR